MTEALVDTNVVVDVYVGRPPYSPKAKSLWQKIPSGEFRPFVSAATVPTVFYLVAKATDEATADVAIAELLKDCQIISVDGPLLQEALDKNWPDFEDAVQDAAAERANLLIIVTRDPKGFASSSRRIVDAATLAQEIDQASASGP